MTRALLAAAILALLAPGAASAGRFAVGVAPGASIDRVAVRVSAATGVEAIPDRTLDAVLVETRDPARLRSLAGVDYVERVQSRRLAFVPNDPLVTRQWYLNQIRAFDFWPQAPSLPGVRVAIIDSGIDGNHPDLKGRIEEAKSFVGGSALTDSQGHGTFVAGVIAAAAGNGQGIAGIGLPAELLVAKVVRNDRTIPLVAEARAIRWAADRGARVINLSLAGLRDPLSLRRDTYSPLEASAIRYAQKKGALVVAAVGNSDQAPRAPWNFAGYPAALPHVLGVSALERDGSVPEFSNRDAFYNDVSAPGADIYSTLPRALTAATRANCANQGYSDCGPPEFRRAEGTSFAAPMAAGAAALLLGARPLLSYDQVATLLERNASDVNAASGCRACPAGRDRLSGWGRLDVVGALVQAVTGPVPPSDVREPNDDAGTQAATIWGRKTVKIAATIDYWDDQIDVYRVRLRKGQRLSVVLKGPSGGNSNLLLWKPGTTRVEDLSPAAQRRRVAQSVRPGSVERIRGFKAARAGWYFVEVKISSRSAGPYSLAVAKKR